MGSCFLESGETVSESAGPVSRDSFLRLRGVSEGKGDGRGRLTFLVLGKLKS